MPSRTLLTTATLLFACTCAFPQALTPARPADTEKAEQSFLSGSRLLQASDLAGAQAAFQKAAVLNPAKPEYAQAFQLTRERRVGDLMQRAAKARMVGQEQQADTLVAEAKTLDPTNDLVLEHINAAQNSSGTSVKATIIPSHEIVFGPPVQLLPDLTAHDLHLRGDAQQALTQAASTFGIKAIFDASVTSEPLPPLRFDLEQTTYAQAMPLLLKITHMFSVPLDSKQLLIARDNQDDRTRLERQIQESIYVPAATPEQLTELTSIVKNVFDVKQVVVGATSGMLLIRAPMPTLLALNETLNDLMDGSSEVVMQVKLVAVDKSSTLNTGATLPTSAGAFNVYQEAQSVVSANQSLVQAIISSGTYVPTGNSYRDTLAEAVILLESGAVTDSKLTGLIAVIGGGEVGQTGVFLSSGVALNFGFGGSDSRALDDITVRAGDRQTTTLRIGEKYPITTATYSSGINSSALAGVTIGGQSASSLLNQYLGASSIATIPQVQYEDLGITLKATPTVLRSGLIDVKIDMKIEALTGASLDGIPVLTSRVFTSDIMVPDGSSAVMLSDLSKTESAVVNGLPGLSDLPGFNASAADRLRTVDTSELVLTITPHLVSHRKDLFASRRIPFATSAPQEF